MAWMSIIGSGTSSILPVLSTLIAAATIISSAVQASEFVSFESPDCTDPVRVQGCGCNPLDGWINFGYQWEQQGQNTTAHLYNQPDCEGTPHTTLVGTIHTSCTRIGWNSIRIDCSNKLG